MAKSNIKYDENCDNCKVFYMVNGHFINNQCWFHVKKFRCLNCNKGYSHKYTLIDHIKKNNCSSETTHCYYCNCKIKSINNHICKYIKIMLQLNSNKLNINNGASEYNYIDSLLFNDSENDVASEYNYIDSLLFNDSENDVDVKSTLKFSISKTEFNSIDRLLFDNSENVLDSIYSVKLID